MRGRAAAAAVLALVASTLGGAGRGAGAAPLVASVLRLGAPTPVPADGDGPVTLHAISCPGPGTCEAVGIDGVGRDVTASGAESQGRWTWSAARPDPGPLRGSGLVGVSCASTSSCVAVGNGAGAQAEVTWGAPARGTWRWRAPVTLSADGSGGGVLTAVSCASRTTCVAVGVDAASEGIVTVGTARGTAWAWTRPAALVPDATGSGGLWSVSCGSAASCVAVGSDAQRDAIVASGTDTTGGWTWTASTSFGAGTDALSGVSCATGAWCVAVGGASGGPGTLLVGRRSDGSWRWGASGALGAGHRSIDGVSCRTERLCVAVGSEVLADGSTAAYELLRGTGGGLVASPTQSLAASGPPVAALGAVSCATVNSCTALGATATGGAVAAGSKAAPSPVRSVGVRAMDAGALVTWRAPGFDGGARIEGYRATARPGGASCGALADARRSSRCVLHHLVNGTRYRVTVTADNGVGVSPAVPARTAVVPTPFQPPVGSPLTRRVAAFVASRADLATVAVYDVSTGQTWRLDPASVQHTASIAKVEILAALLHDEQVAHTTMSPSTRALATEMIEDSDNLAAQALYVQVGQEPGLAAFNALVGLTGTTANWAWGYTDTTSLDQTRIVRLFAVPNAILTDASREFGLSLLRHVTPDQAWGVSAGPGAGVSVALKNGWYPTGPGDWQVNSIGWVDGERRDYVLAVLTKDNATFSEGVATIEAISTMVWQGLAPHPAPVVRPQD